MRESMARLTPRFSADRTVREYVERYYLPASEAYRSRMADKGSLGRQMVEWRRGLEGKWPALRFGEVKVETNGGQYVFEVQVHLSGLDPKSLRVELYADGLNGDGPARQEMKPLRPPADGSDVAVYGGSVPAARPAADYTARAIPQRKGVSIPLEEERILWRE